MIKEIENLLFQIGFNKENDHQYLFFSYVVHINNSKNNKTFHLVKECVISHKSLFFEDMNNKDIIIHKLNDIFKIQLRKQKIEKLLNE